MVGSGMRGEVGAPDGSAGGVRLPEGERTCPHADADRGRQFSPKNEIALR